MNAAIAEYSKSKKAQGMGVTPHRLVEMLMQSALDKLAVGKGCVLRDDAEGANENLTTVMTIIMTLRGSLDTENGGEVAENLNLLYGYMHTKLMEVFSQRNVEAIDEVSALIKEISNAWKAMPNDIKTATDLSQFANS